MIAPVKQGLVFEPDGHRYYFDGRRVPGNTTLLKEYGIVNLDGIPQERLDYKSALGTAVHLAAHLWDLGDLDESTLDKRIVPFFQAYQKFREITSFEARHTELPLHSAKYGFATTLDKQGPFEWKGALRESIIELKCVWLMMPSNGPQTAAQQIAFEENHPDIKIKGRFGLQLKENGNYEVEEYTDSNDRQTFLACLQIHRFREKHGLLRKDEK